MPFFRFLSWHDYFGLNINDYQRLPDRIRLLADQIGCWSNWRCTAILGDDGVQLMLASTIK